MTEVVLRLPEWLARQLRLLVHDQIVLSVPKDRLEEANAALMDAMSFEWAPPGKSRKVMITGDISLPGKNWADCYRKE